MRLPSGLQQHFQTYSFSLQMSTFVRLPSAIVIRSNHFSHFEATTRPGPTEPSGREPAAHSPAPHTKICLASGLKRAPNSPSVVSVMRIGLLPSAGTTQIGRHTITMGVGPF